MSTYMIELTIDAAGRRPKGKCDRGYLAHCLMHDIFGHTPPKPFHIGKTSGAKVHIIGYSEKSPDDMMHQAQINASARDYNTCDWKTFYGKPMPDAWRRGQRFSFETRVVPMVRTCSKNGRDKGAEVDAFIAYFQRPGPETTMLDRENVYRLWLHRQFESLGARLVGATLLRFSLADTVRRTQGKPRRPFGMQRPEADMCGAIEVVDPDSFHRVFTRGVGRHRSFGFGMVRLSEA